MNKSDISRNHYMLKGDLAKKGYDWWWHSFTGYDKKTNKAKAFFVEYFIINPALGGDKAILGQLPKNIESKKRPSYVMVKVGAWGEDKKQLHNFYPINDMKIAKDKLELSVGNCYLSETQIRGQVNVDSDDNDVHPEYMSDAGTMSWDLKVDKQIAFNVGYGASKFFRTINAFEMFWHAEGMKTQYSGFVTYDGVEYEVIPEKSYGYADKNWGGDFTSPWVWLGSCNMKSTVSGKKLNNSAIDIGGGRPKVFGIPLNRKLLIDLNYEGVGYEFNFSKFWTFTRTKFNCFETDTDIVWEIETQNMKSIMELKCSCKKSEMLNINYEAPNGLKRHNKLWNGGTGKGALKLYSKSKGAKKLIDEIDISNIGCEYGVYDD